MNKFFAAVVMSVITSSAVANTEFTVMHGPGGVSDITTRFLSGQMSETAYPVVNRPGAAGKIAIRHMMSEKTIMLATMVQVFVTNPLNHKDLSYDPKTDLDVIAVIGVMPSALVCNKSTGIENFQQFKTTNKKLTFGVGGYGSSEHVSTEVLIAKLKADHKVIPYAQGGNSAVKDLLGGHIDCMFGNYPTVRSHIENERLVLIMTSHDVGQTVTNWPKEFNEDFPFQSYLSVIAPSNMPANIKTQIKSDFQKSFEKKDFNNRLRELGMFPIASTEEITIKQSLKACENTRKFILDNNIKTSNQ
jgi:tripartite-type tricarboxylate transporter receptor subunit TctC